MWERALAKRWLSWESGPESMVNRRDSSQSERNPQRITPESLVSSNATRLKNAINCILREKARKRRVDSGPEKRGDCNWSIFPLLLLTSTIWFSLDHKRSQKKMETFWFLRLRFRRAYDSAYDSDVLFSQGHKRSYDSAYDSDADSDSIANANHPLTCHFVKN